MRTESDIICDKVRFTGKPYVTRKNVYKKAKMVINGNTHDCILRVARKFLGTQELHKELKLLKIYASSLTTLTTV